MELLTPNPGLIVWMLITFAILFSLLSKFAWKPIVAGLKEREESIDSALRMAEETRAEMAALKADNDKAKAEARAERDGILKEAKEAANKMVADAKEAARIAGEVEINKASEAIRNERTALIAQMRKDVSEISIEIAEKILRRELADKTASATLVSSLLNESKLN